MFLFTPLLLSILLILTLSPTQIPMAYDRSITPPPEPSCQIADEYTAYSKKSRHGHGKDVVDDNNIRQVAGCIPLDMINKRILLISSRKKKNAWVLPKGGWEHDETQKHAAQRETWEEAGIKGTITHCLGVFEERTPKKNKLKAHHWIFEMEIEEVAKKFPERKKRERRWFTFEEALIATQHHPYIQQAISQCSLNPGRSPPSPRTSLDDNSLLSKPSIKQTSDESKSSPPVHNQIKLHQSDYKEDTKVIMGDQKNQRKSFFISLLKSVFQ